MLKFLKEWRELIGDIFIIVFGLLMLGYFTLLWFEGSVTLFEDNIPMRIFETILSMFIIGLAIERTARDIGRISKRG